MSVTLKTTLFPAVCAGPVYCCTSAVYYLLFVLSACFCSILEQTFQKDFKRLSKDFTSFFFKYCEDNISDFANLLNTTLESSKDRVTLKNPFLLLFSKGYSYQI